MMRVCSIIGFLLAITQSDSNDDELLCGSENESSTFATETQSSSNTAGDTLLAHRHAGRHIAVVVVELWSDG